MLVEDIILGIDPGTKITGYGLLCQKKFGALLHLNSGCIRTRSSDLPSRLKTIYLSISQIIRTFKPDCVAIEKIFVSKNVDSAIKLGQACGVVVLAAANFSVPTFDYTVQQIKRTVVGSGSAEKNQVRDAVCDLLKLPSGIQIDAADALAIAITHHTRKVFLPRR